MPDRVHCPHCGRYPSLRKNGRISQHRYQWPHKQDGRRCPGSGQRPNHLHLDEGAPQR